MIEPAIGLAEFSIFNRQERGRLLVILKAYMDDSGEETSQHEFISLFGYVGDEVDWGDLEPLWAQALEKEGISALHLRADKDRTACLIDCAKVIEDCHLHGFGSVIRRRDFERFKQTRGLEISDYGLNLYIAQLTLSANFPDHQIQVMLDRGTQRPMEKAIAEAKGYVMTHDFWANRVVAQIVVSQLSAGCTYRNMRAIQAADFLAWEVRKDLTDKNGWFSTTEERGTQEAHQSMIDWIWDNKGVVARSGYLRPSLNSLLKQLIPCPVMEYEELERLHEARNGIWPKL